MKLDIKNEKIKSLFQTYGRAGVAIILIIVLCVLVARFTDSPKNGNEDSQTETESTLSGEQETETAEQKTIDSSLQKDAYPEIQDLMERYFEAKLSCDVEALHKSSTAEEQSYLTSVHHLQEQIQQLQTIVPLFLPSFLTRSATIATANAKKSKKRPDGSKNSKPAPRKASSFDVVCTTRSKNSAETSASSRVCVRPSSPTASTAVLPRCGWRATRRCSRRR